MIRPDLKPICENMLMAEGFVKARSIAVKFVTLYSLSSELLSKQVSHVIDQNMECHQQNHLTVYSYREVARRDHIHPSVKEQKSPHLLPLSSIPQ